MMGRGKLLTKQEKAQIRVLNVEGLSQRMIVERIGRSKSAVGNYLKGINVAKRRVKRGRKPILSERKKRSLIRDARKGLWSARQLA